VSLALRPVCGFPAPPGWSLRHRLLRPVCPIYARCVPRSSPLAGKARWFIGSCLVTGNPVPTRMGSGWLPNTFSLTESLRAGFFALAGARTSLTLAQVYPPSYARRGTALLASQTEYASRDLVMSRLRQLPANPFHSLLNVCFLEVGLLLTTRSCPLEADQPGASWRSEPPG